MKIDKISNSIKNINTDTSLYKKLCTLEILFHKIIKCEKKVDGFTDFRASTSLYSLCSDSLINWDLFIDYVYFQDVLNDLGIIDILEKVEEKSYIGKKDFLKYCQFLLNCIQRVFLVLKENKVKVQVNNEILNTIAQVKKLITKYLDELGYNSIYDDYETYIIEKEPGSRAVAEIYPNLADAVLEYRRVDLKGNLTRKKELLQVFAHEFEPIRLKLHKDIKSKAIADDLGFLFNNCNIRHNNADGKNRKEYIASIKSDELEVIYDKTYDYFLLAMMHLNYIDNKELINELRARL